VSNVKCPYCGAEQEIDHDYGYGYEEDQKHEQECFSCEKRFVYTTAISFSYETRQAECLNGADHKYSNTNTYPVRYTKMRCEDCGHERKCTDEELSLLSAGKETV
jgi:hypothetical protein